MTTKFIALAVLALTAAVPILAQERSAPAGDPQKGSRDFRETGCYACHGTVGHGGGWQGPKLAPDPIPYGAFLAQLRDPARAMPPYSRDVLSDADAADIYAYLRSIPHGKPASRIGILNR